MDEERILRAMRTMAWERAKGELMSIGHTMYPNYDNEEERKKRKRFFEIMEAFIQSVDDEELIH